MPLGRSHSLQLNAVVGDVEAEEQLNLLRLLNGDEMHGYLFSKPAASVIFDTRFLVSSCRRDDAITINPRGRATRCKAVTTSGPWHGIITSALIETDDAVLYEADNGGREWLFVSSQETMPASIS